MMAGRYRTIGTAQPGRDYVQVLDGAGQLGHRVAVSDLKRPELVAAAAMAYPGIRGDAWLRQSNPTIVRALVDMDLPPDLASEPAPDPKRAKQRSTAAARRAMRETGVAPPVPPVDNAADASVVPDAGMPAGIAGLVAEVLRPLVAEEVRRALSGVRFVIDNEED